MDLRQFPQIRPRSTPASQGRGQAMHSPGRVSRSRSSEHSRGSASPTNRRRVQMARNSEEGLQGDGDQGSRSVSSPQNSLQMTDNEGNGTLQEQQNNAAESEGNPAANIEGEGNQGESDQEATFRVQLPDHDNIGIFDNMQDKLEGFKESEKSGKDVESHKSQNSSFFMKIDNICWKTPIKGDIPPPVLCKDLGSGRNSTSGEHTSQRTVSSWERGLRLGAKFLKSIKERSRAALRFSSTSPRRARSAAEMRRRPRTRGETNYKDSFDLCLQSKEREPDKNASPIHPFQRLDKEGENGLTFKTGYQTPSEDGDEKYSSWMRRSGRSKSVPMEVLNPWPTALATLKKPFQPSPPTASEELASPAHQNGESSLGDFDRSHRTGPTDLPMRPAPRITLRLPKPVNRPNGTNVAEQLPTNKQPSEFFMDFYSAGDKVFLSDDEDYGEPNDWGNGTSGFPTTSRELTNGFSTSRGGNNSIFNYGSTYGKTNGETTVLQLTAREEQMISAAWKKLLLKKVTRKLKAMEPSGPPKLLTKEERAAKIRAEFSNLMDETILEDDVKAGLENEAAEAWMENEAANVWIGLEEQEAWRDLEEQVAGSEYERRGIPRGAARGPSIRRPKTPQKHFYYSSEDEEEEYDRRVEEQRMKGN